MTALNEVHRAIVNLRPIDEMHVAHHLGIAHRICAASAEGKATKEFVYANGLPPGTPRIRLVVTPVAPARRGMTHATKNPDYRPPSARQPISRRQKPSGQSMAPIAV
jgi:hypothetical protein